jgi:hypothetical protein
MLKRLLHPISFGFRSQLTDVILVVNAFVWYYATLVFFLEEIILNSLMWGLHFG